MNSKMNTKKTLLASMVGLFAAAGGASSAMAQGDEAATAQGRIDEIIVTAQKREQKLTDVPISIAALSGEKIESAGIQNINDLSYAVPNLSVWERGPGQQAIIIRGVGNEQGSSSLVGMYLDEAPVSAIPIAQVDLRAIDLERVEVLRGPQGTLYGQGSIGGTIRFVTKKPSFDGLDGSLSLSAYDTKKGGWSKEINGIVNIPVVEDVLAFRLAATFEDKSGWIDQPAVSDEDINDNELSNLRFKALWQATESMTINGTIINHRNEGGGGNIVNTDPIEDSNFLSAVDPTISPRFTDDYDLYNLTIDYDLGFSTLTSSSSYLDIEKYERAVSQFAFFFFAPTTLGEVLRQNESQDANVFTQEIRLSSFNDGSALEWTAGIFYSDSERRFRNDGIEIALGGALFPPGLPTDDERLSESTAIFGDVSYMITENLKIGIGSRYFEDDREFNGGGLSASEKFYNLSSKGYLSFSIGENSTIYASISEGFRSGGFNGAAGVLAGGELSYDPEKIVSYEIGAKGSFPNSRINADFSIFRSKYTDFQSLAFDPLSSDFSIFNTGEAEIEGIELSLIWTATDHLSLGLNGNVTDAEFTKINGNPPTTQVAGDPLDYVPEYSYSFTADLSFSLSANTLGYFRLDYSHQGPNSVANRTAFLDQEVFHSESIGFLNTHIGAEWEAFHVEFFGKNLLDEDRATTAVISRLSPQNRPRTLGLKFSYDF